MTKNKELQVKTGKVETSLPNDKKFSENSCVRRIEIVTQKEEDYERLKLQIELDSKGVKPFIKEYAYIMHDKDTHVDDETAEIVDTPTHFQGMISLKSPCKISTLMKRYDLPFTVFCKIKSSRMSQYLQYLTHANAPEKYQYDDSQVITNIKNWEFGRDAELAKTEIKEMSVNLELIIKKILNNEYTERDIKMGGKIPPELYIQYSNKIDKAFSMAEKFKMDEMQVTGITKQKSTIFIQGMSGAGKTEYAKAIAVQKGLNPYVSTNSKAPYDKYAGQNAIVFDEVRGSKWEFTNFLNITDPFNITPVDNRFKDKVPTIELSIFTTCDDFEDFIESMNGSTKADMEQKKQVRRRVPFIMKVYPDVVEIYEYNYEKDKHEYVKTIPNQVEEIFKYKRTEKSDITIDDLVVTGEKYKEVTTCAVDSSERADTETSSDAERQGDKEDGAMETSIR